MSKAHKKYHVIISILFLIVVCLSIIIILTILKSGQSESDKPPIKELSEIDFDNLKAPKDPFLKAEEVVIVEDTSTSSKKQKVILPVTKVLFEYIEVINGCGPHFAGECLNVRSGPSMKYPIIAKLRNGMVFKVGGQVEHDGIKWYKIVFDEWLRYPERVKNDWYVASDYVKILLDEGEMADWDIYNENNGQQEVEKTSTSSTKKIIVDRSEQKLYAYENEDTFMEIPISTGLELTPTPRGEFTIFKKTPSRYMQGPLPNLVDQQYYDLPGVPWNLYFTKGGAVIHGAYWHDSFGSAYSHGCVNVRPSNAKKLYNWAELGTKVIVRD